MAYKNNLKPQQFILYFLNRKQVSEKSKLQSAGTLGHFKLKNENVIKIQM